MRTPFVISILCAASIAHAEPSVVAVAGKDIYIDLGAKDGVGTGSALELLHEIVAKDPRTGATLRDHFALGKLVVVKSGGALCVARDDGDLDKRVLAGDHVRLASAKRDFEDPWEQRVAASHVPAPPPRDPTAPAIDHVGLARQAWLDTLGQPPEQRIARWSQLVEADPQGPYRKAIDGEIASLRSQIVQREAAVEKARSSATGDRGPRIAQLAAQLDNSSAAPLAVAPIARAVPGRAIDLAFLVRAPSAVAHAWLYVRPDGVLGFHRTELVRDGDAYLRGAIDAALVRGSYIEWYVEVADASGEAEPVIGTLQVPQRIEVERVVKEAPIAHGRSQVDLHLDYVNFDGATTFDQYYQAEADFAYRFIDPIYAVRLGFGTLSGTGGPKDVIDNDPMHCLDSNGVYQCKRVTFSYVYTELEFRLRPNVALMVRPQVGELTTDTMPGSTSGRCQTSDIASCEFETGVGGRLRLRLGEELGTNLVLGAGFTRGVGTLLEAAYHWLPAEVVPVQITVQVTDQPVIEDFGVRLIGDVGYRKLSWIYPSVRVSYQARDLNHTGVSGGLGLNFDW